MKSIAGIREELGKIRRARVASGDPYRPPPPREPVETLNIEEIPTISSMPENYGENEDLEPWPKAEVEGFFDSLDRAVSGEQSGRSRLGIDALAWYVSFHHEGDDWGIFVPVSSLEYLVTRHLKSLRRDQAQKAQIAFEMLLHHELFHFAADYAIAQWELLITEPIWAYMADALGKQNHYLEIEEKLANAYMLQMIRSSCTRPALTAIETFVAGQPSGYRDALDVRTKKDLIDELPEHLSHYLGLYAAKHRLNIWSEPFEAGSFYQFLPQVDSRQCPIHIIHDEHKAGLPPKAYRIIQSIAHIEESKRFQKSFRKLPANIKRQWEKKKVQLAHSVPRHPEFEKFGDCFSIRVTRQYRAHLLPPDQGNAWKAIDIGTHTEMGHG